MRSKQSMQFTRKTPFCRENNTLSQTQKYLIASLQHKKLTSVKNRYSYPCVSNVRSILSIRLEMFSYLKQMKNTTGQLFDPLLTSFPWSRCENHIHDIFSKLINISNNQQNTDIPDIFHIKFMHMLPITLSYNTLFAVLFSKIDDSLASCFPIRRINMI